MLKRVLLTGLVALALTVTAATAQTGDGYDLTWSTVDGGGGVSTSSDGYSLHGTIGQPDAGVVGNGSYTLAGGFWAGGSLTVVVPAMAAAGMLLMMSGLGIAARRRQPLPS